MVAAICGGSSYLKGFVGTVLLGHHAEVYLEVHGACFKWGYKSPFFKQGVHELWRFRDDSSVV